MILGQARPAHLHGVALSVSWADASRNLMELIFECVTAALADAGTTIAAVDSVVLGAHDLIDGRSLSSMVTAPAAGSYLRDEIRLAEDGLAALSLAAARVEAGESELSVVAAWGRASEGGFLQMSRSSADPFLEQPFGLGDLDVSAFRLSRWLAAYPGADAARREAAAERLRRAAAHPRALRGGGESLPVPRPLRPDEGPRFADIVAAAIVGRAEGPVRIAGLGHGTDEPALGARDLLRMPALATAVAGATAGAGCTLAEIGTVELDGMTLADEAIAAEAIGLCAPGEGFAALARHEGLNASGGGAGGWCYPAMGLARLVEASLSLREADASRSGRRLALATGLGGRGGQTATASVLEAR